MFGEVWAKWPLSKLVHPGWREAFRFFDTLGAALATLVRFLLGDFASIQTQPLLVFASFFFWGEAFCKEEHHLMAMWNQ